jgi:acyl carrier protein
VASKCDEIIGEVLELDPHDLSGGLSPDNVETWSSLNHLRLITELENAFVIKLSMADIQSIENVADIRRIVGQYTSKAT